MAAFWIPTSQSPQESFKKFKAENHNISFRPIPEKWLSLKQRGLVKRKKRYEMSQLPGGWPRSRLLKKALCEIIPTKAVTSCMLRYLVSFMCRLAKSLVGLCFYSFSHLDAEKTSTAQDSSPSTSNHLPCSGNVHSVTSGIMGRWLRVFCRAFYWALEKTLFFLWDLISEDPPVIVAICCYMFVFCKSKPTSNIPAISSRYPANHTCQQWSNVLFATGKRWLHPSSPTNNLLSHFVQPIKSSNI